MDDMRNLSRAGNSLPVDALAALQLLNLFRDPDHDVDRIVEFISQDPVLAHETLKRCNNAVYRGSEKITDIFEAVSRLGFYEVYGIITETIGMHGEPSDILAAAEKLAAPPVGPTEELD